MSVSSRGYGITKADLEASRLVFVSLRDSVPKRKVAVPVPDEFTWEQFLEQVKSKLRLEGVGSVYFASTGEKISSLDGLEDIDELYVEEATARSAEANGNYPVLGRKEPSTSEVQISPSPSTRIHRQSSIPADGKLSYSMDVGTNEVIDEDEDAKYVKRSTLLKRMAQRIFPESFTPGLPITASKSTVSEEKGGKKRRRRNRTDGKTLLLLCAVVGSLITMTLLFFRTASNPNSV